MQTLKSTGLCLDVRAAPGNTFVDVSRYHHTITNNNVVTVKGMGDALAGGYDGATAYLDCGNPSAFDITDAITIEAWVKPTAIMTNSGIVGPKSWGEWARLGIKHAIKHLTLVVGDGTNYDAYDAGGIIIEQWNYVVGVTESENYIKLYINGQQVGSTHAITQEITRLAGRDTRIGTSWAGSEYFNGSIFLARIYNRALPAYEILDHYYEYAALLGLD